jgi:pimeloyl-ACP methyl ester carboxylesterase
MIRRTVITSILAVLVCALFAAPRTAQAQDTQFTPTFEGAECPFGNITQYTIECGWLTVPEDHAAPNGKTIRLAVAVIRSTSANKAPDPVVYLAGGPGAAFVESAPRAVFMFGFPAILVERDVILVDQRGMGLSEPLLTCTPYASIEAFFTEPRISETRVAEMQKCRERFAEQGIDPTLYDIHQNAADFGMIAQAMGYESVNFYGTSWGTRLGLIILRDHPERIRTLILDSVLPPHINPMENAAPGFYRAFQNMAARCEADALCRTAYPNLQQMYEDTYARLQREPIPLTVDGLTLQVTANGFAGAIYRAFLSGEDVIPSYISNIAQNDTRALEQSTSAILEYNQLPEQAPFFSECTDFVGTTTLDRIHLKAANLPAAYHIPGDFDGENGYLYCKQWTGDIPPKRPEARTVSDLPVLILSGEQDAITPPEWAREVASTLSKGQMYTFAGLTHGTAADPCVQSVIVGFLQNPDAPNTKECAAPAKTYTLSIQATRPPIQILGVLLFGVALWGVGSVGAGYVRGHNQIAWRASLRRMGWLPLVLGGLGVFALLTNTNLMPSEVDGLSAVQMIIPLIMGVQAAMLFSPDDEPGLEMLLVMARPITWLVMERLAVVVAAQSVVALFGITLTVVLRPEQNLIVLLLSWIGSALFLSGLGMYITIRSRQMVFGMAVIAFLWAAFALFSSLFLPGTGEGWFFPLNLIQPFLWAIHVHARPADFSAMSDFWLNRAFLSVFGIALMVAALRDLRDSERVLLSVASKSSKRRTDSNTAAEIIPLRTALQIRPVNVDVRPLQQVIGAAWYESKLHWRRRGFKVLALTIILCASTLILIMGTDVMQFLPTLPPLDTLPPDQAQIALGLVSATLIPGLIVLVMTMVLPLLVADIVPMDSQRKIDDLLNSLPQSAPVYLGAKVLGVWIAGVQALFVSVVLLGVLWLLRIGAYNPIPFLDAVLTGALPAVLIYGAIGVLVGATQPTRRRAIVVVILYLGIPMLLAAPLVGTAFEVFLPIRFTVLAHYFTAAMQNLATAQLTLPPSGLTNPTILAVPLIGAVQIALLWSLALFVAHRKSKA